MCLRIHVFETRASECRQICQIKLKLELSFNQTAPSYFWLSVKDEYPKVIKIWLPFATTYMCLTFDIEDEGPSTTKKESFFQSPI